MSASWIAYTGLLIVAYGILISFKPGQRNKKILVLTVLMGIAAYLLFDLCYYYFTFNLSQGS